MASTPPIKWSHVKQQVKSWEAGRLVGLVQELFDLSADNRLYLATRFGPRPSADDAAAMDAALEPYIKRIDRIFYTRADWPQDKMLLGEGRRIVAAYRKASGDLAGTLDLMLYFVEVGTRFTLQFGDIDAPFYTALVSMLVELEAALRTGDGRPLYAGMRDRLEAVAASARHIGWGYGDEVGEIVGSLRTLCA